MGMLGVDVEGKTVETGDGLPWAHGSAQGAGFPRTDACSGMGVTTSCRSTSAATVS